MEHLHQRLYPSHIYDATRREIAIELIEKEFQKLPHPDAEGMNIDVRAWMDKMDEFTFWNSVEGFMGGALLKPIVHFFTAENFAWSKQEVPVSSLQLSSKLAQLDSLGELAPDELFLTSIAQRVEEREGEHERQLEAAEKYRLPNSKDEYAILVVERKDGPMVMDGNGRALTALLRGEETIHAWVAKTAGQQPRNFWYPVDDLMRLTKIYTSMKEVEPEVGTYVRGTLTALFRESEVARITYKERLVKIGAPGAKELYEGL